METKRFDITFKSSPRKAPRTWQRFGASIEAATENVKRALVQEFGPKAVLLSVVEVPMFQGESTPWLR